MIREKALLKANKETTPLAASTFQLGVNQMRIQGVRFIMSGGVYGGDEVSGVVFDAGSHSLRVGFAGEEYPKGDIPSYVAVQEVEPDEDVEMKEGTESNNVKKKRNMFIGTTKIVVPRPRTTIQSFMKDGMIDDWEMFENLLDYSYSEVLHSETQYHPALFTESAWNDKAKRERLTELMFEKYNIPAFFLCKNALIHFLRVLVVLKGEDLDEVSGVVFDAGSHSLRVGFAGEEYPKGDIPSYVAVQEVEPDEDVEMKEGTESNNVKKKRNMFIGTTKIVVPRPRTTIQSFMKDGMIDDWEMFENLLDYSYSEVLHSETQYHPALFTESAWNDKAKRERLTELMFEKYNIPAFFLCKNAVLTAFANGRTSGLVVDSGATQTSAVPVYDGYAVTHAVVRSPIGGDVICEQLQHMLDEQNIEVVPIYKIGGKEEVNENEPPRWTKRKNLPEVTESYDKFMKKQLLEDMAVSVLQLCDTPLDAEYAEKLPSAPYSFPNGFTKMWLLSRKVDCAAKDEVFFMTPEKHSEPLSEECTWMSMLKVFKKPIGDCKQFTSVLKISTNYCKFLEALGFRMAQSTGSVLAWQEVH
ncbi:Actin [Teladorsagia circumcincta]|uniref:Actin n=1 Tax=Teladorsagia circumcincta TaxID=45464 RepID=A0A2G9URY1_TELCI|nr:Actin [Teladorsagia circumcincta]